MTIKTVLPKGQIVLQSANSRGLVTATSKSRSHNLADFDPASLLDKKRQKTFTETSK
jgi:hypothetical protein